MGGHGFGLLWGADEKCQSVTIIKRKSDIKQEKTNTRIPVILLVEDDVGDQELVKIALEKANIRCRLFIVDNGEAAVDYILRRHAFADEMSAPSPDLILLDLNMPKMGGIEVMRQLQSLQSVWQLAVVVLTTSTARKDIATLYELGVKSYIAKPDTFSGYIQLFETIGAYWFNSVLLPPLDPKRRHRSTDQDAFQGLT